jgi:ATP-binding cassette subfamily F protein 3
MARWSEQMRRDHLGQFGFKGERVFEPVSRFSGGERARLSLAILVARRPNLLLLDEPTNHLDFEMRESLLLALQDFAGAVIIVSHDRSLLRGVCDEFLLVADGEARPFDGDLEDYAAWLGKRRQGVSQKAAAPPGIGNGSGNGNATTSAERREQRRGDAAARQKLAPLRQEVEKIEARLVTLTGERERLERRLADPEVYESQATQRDLTARHGVVTTEMDRLETRWLELTEQLEAAKEKGGSLDPPERGSLVR